MSLRIREDGRVLCAAMHPPQPGDVWLDDAVHYRLSVDLRVLVTEPMNEGGLGGHAAHGEWWWRDQVPPAATVDKFYSRADGEEQT